jgi:hypothetical protein
MPYSSFVSGPTGSQSNPDTIHYNATGYRTLGASMATAYDSAIVNMTPSYSLPTIYQPTVWIDIAGNITVSVTEAFKLYYKCRFTTAPPTYTGPTFFSTSPNFNPGLTTSVGVTTQVAVMTRTGCSAWVTATPPSPPDAPTGLALSPLTPAPTTGTATLTWLTISNGITAVNLTIDGVAIPPATVGISSQYTYTYTSATARTIPWTVSLTNSAGTSPVSTSSFASAVVAIPLATPVATQTAAVAGSAANTNTCTVTWPAVPNATSYDMSWDGVTWYAITSPWGAVYNTAGVTVWPVPWYLRAVSTNPLYSPSVRYNGSFYPLLVTPPRYSSFLASTAVADASNKISQLVDATGNARNLVAVATGREAIKATALLSTKTPAPPVIQTSSAADSTLTDVTLKRCIPLTGDYTRMFTVFTRVAADFQANRTYFGSWNNGGHIIVSSAANVGTIYTGENGGVIRSAMATTMVPNKWYCIFLTYTSATKMASWYCNGAKVGTDGAYNQSFDHTVADPHTCIGGVNGVTGWTPNSDILECAVWNSVLTAPMVVEETTRLATLYGISLN